jgi:hypothetical protein
VSELTLSLVFDDEGVCRVLDCTEDIVFTPTELGRFVTALMRAMASSSDVLEIELN